MGNTKKKSKKVIPIKCEGTQYVDFHELNLFQENIKKLSSENLKKLKNSLITGIKAPQFVWKYKNKWYILDGTQRQSAFYLIEEDGYIIPKVPVVEIFAKTKREAKANVLIYVSQHGEVDKDKLELYIKKYDIQLQDIVIRTNDMDLNTGDNEIEIKEKDVDILDTNNECPQCGYTW